MSNLTDVMFPPVNYGHTNARISTMSVAQDSQFNDVAFWSNSPGIIESEEERDFSTFLERYARNRNRYQLLSD